MSEREPLTHVVGARPNFVKAAPVHAALGDRGVAQRVVHTGQHYDEALSEVFFRQLGLPEPDVDLGVGSGSHATQTAALLTALEGEFLQAPPRAVIAYGDVNSTLAAGLVCAKLHLPIVHVEAGLRSFDRTMPEEVNRVVVDQLADLLLTTSEEAADNLAAEGVDTGRVRFVGNTMIDTLARHRDRFDTSAVRARLDLPQRYAAATLHRPANVDDPDAAAALVAALAEVCAQLPLVLPLHPRGRASFAAAGLFELDDLHVIEPLGYLEFMALVQGAAVVITDSGGVQEETTVLGVPCCTVRPNTERPVTITHGTNRLVTPAELPGAVADALSAGGDDQPGVPPLWDGEAGGRAADAILAWLTGGH